MFKQADFRLTFVLSGDHRRFVGLPVIATTLTTTNESF